MANECVEQGVGVAQIMGGGVGVAQIMGGSRGVSLAFVLSFEYFKAIS